MKNNLFFLLCGSAFIILLSCKPDNTKAPNDNSTGINVKLNNGAKWEANVETTQGISNMLGLANDMAAKPTLEDFRLLHTSLNAEFQSILQQCTMSGEAHNQLHSYLMPLKEKIDLLASADLDTCKRILPELKEYIMKYSHFFFT